MSKNLLKLCMCACAALGFSACDTGEHNNLDCDESYVADCLDGSVYMMCSNNKLTVVHCDNDQVCQPTAEGAKCAPRGAAEACVSVCAIDGTTLRECQDDGSTKNVDCRDQNPDYMCIAGECKLPSTCENTCASDSKLLQCKDDGTTEEVDCADIDSSYVCRDNACKAPACQPTCNEDGLLLGCIDDDHPAGIPVDCAELEGDNFVCDKGACVEKCTESVCNEDGTLTLCNDDGTTEIVECEDNLICDAGACVDLCSEEAIACEDDGITLKTCKLDVEGGFTGEYERIDCSEEGMICSHAECINASSVVGTPCTCEGSDCDIILTSDMVKSMFTDNEVIRERILNEYLVKLGDEDQVVAPNFFSANNKGCEELAESLPTGMVAACFRSAKVDIADSFLNLISTDMVVILQDVVNPDSSQTFMDFADALSKFQYTAKGGYCMPVALDVKVEFKGDAAMLFNGDTFAEDSDLMALFNHGDHSAALAAFQSSTEEEPYCPENSTFYSYYLSKGKHSTNDFGSVAINFDMCLQNCTIDENCRDGYTCTAPSAAGFNVRIDYPTDAKICFNEDNFDYFLGLKAFAQKFVNALIR